jgi:hypothetical protein
MPASKKKTSRAVGSVQMAVGKKTVKSSVKKLRFLAEQEQQLWSTVVATLRSTAYLFSSFII